MFAEFASFGSRQAAAKYALSGHGPGDRIVGLVARYPHVSASEAAEILTFLKTARYVDVARVQADPSIRRQLDMFVARHRHKLKRSATELVSIASLAIAFLAICWLLWNAAAIGGAP